MTKDRLVDLDKEQFELLDGIVKQHIPSKTVWAYGSRVDWTANEKSDLDLVVFDCDPAKILALKEAFAESNLMVSVDVMDWESIPDNFKENIKKKYVMLQEEQRLTGWREVQLGDVARIKKESWRNGNAELPYIGLEHIDENKLRLNGVGSSNSIISNKFNFNAGDTLFGKLRPYFRKVVKPTFDGICSTDIWVVIPKGDTNKDFLFYFFANQELVDISYSSSSGTRMPRADWNFLSQTVWTFPPLPEQKAIAEILSSLDDKIDLLHRQNKTLEDMAQTLFRKWFIEDADEGWEEKPLEYFGNIICGKTPSKKMHKYFGGKIPFIKIPDMHGKTFVFDTTDTLTKEGKDSQRNKTIPERSICISCIATVGLVSMSAFESQTNQQINSITPKKNEYRYFIYLFMKSINDLLHAMASGGTATMNLNTGNFAKIPVPVADEGLIYEFHFTAEPIFGKIHFNQKQIRTLENLRDTLLPKLMSGKVKV